jgi:hypothetical protein
VSPSGLGAGQPLPCASRTLVTAQTDRSRPRGKKRMGTKLSSESIEKVKRQRAMSPTGSCSTEALLLQPNLTLDLVDERLGLAHQRFALLLSGEHNHHAVRAGPIDKGRLPRHPGDIGIR